MLIDGMSNERPQYKIINCFLRDDVTQNSLMSLEDTESPYGKMIKDEGLSGAAKRKDEGGQSTQEIFTTMFLDYACFPRAP